LLLGTDFFIIQSRRWYVNMKRTPSRKKQHVDIVLKKDVSFHLKTAGFERWDFLHNALPELNFSEIDPSTTCLGKPVALPFIIASMTGGYAEATRINRQLAEACARKKIAMGVGSQRQALEDARYHASYSIVREVAKDIPVFGNIGAVEVAALRDASQILKLIDLIQADGFAVHLNPLQELLQPEGNTNFRGVLAGIEMLAKSLPVPLIVKEIGAGISPGVARRLIDAGVSIIDVAGAGGTSWAGVEILRRETRRDKRTAGNDSLSTAFWDWGIPTADALVSLRAVKSDHPSLKVVASGGIASGIDSAKAIAFGADYVSAARPVLKALSSGGVRSVLRLIDRWELEFKGAMFLTGSRSLADLQEQKLTPRT
jgi:isopentenyl-diphosphate delta-isomerase